MYPNYEPEGQGRGSTFRVCHALFTYAILLNPIPGGLWNYVVRRGGAIMARTFKRRQKLAKIPSSAPKLDLR